MGGAVLWWSPCFGFFSFPIYWSKIKPFFGWLPVSLFPLVTLLGTILLMGKKGKWPIQWSSSVCSNLSVEIASLLVSSNVGIVMFQNKKWHILHFPKSVPLLMKMLPGVAPVESSALGDFWPSRRLASDGNGNPCGLIRLSSAKIILEILHSLHQIPFDHTLGWSIEDVRTSLN